VSTPTKTGSPSPAPMIWLVAEREIGSKLRSKAFLISTGVLLLIALAGIVIGVLLERVQAPLQEELC